MTILRILAVAVAIGGVVDPTVQMERRVPVPVRLLADPEDPDAASAAARLQTALSGQVDLVERGSAAASVIVGTGGAGGGVPGDGPVSVVALEEAPSVAIAEVPGTVSLTPGSTIDIPVVLRAVGLAGRTTVVLLEQDGVELARANQAWSRDGAATVHLPYTAPVPGARRLTVRVESAPGEQRVRDNQAVLLATARAREARIAVVELRPSWSAGFVRRHLEQDSAFRVSSVLRTSRGIAWRSGEPPAIQARQLSRFDVVIVGGPEELQRAELEALWQFAGRRGGTVVLLPDRFPTGPYRERLPARLTEQLLSEPRVLEPAGILASEVVSLPALPRAAQVLATLGRTPAIVSWPVGAGRVVFSGALDAWRYRADPKSRLAPFWRDELLSAALNAPPPVLLEVAPAVLRPGDVATVKVRLRRTEWEDSAGQGGEIRLPAVEGRVSDPAGALEPIRLWPEVERGTFRGEASFATAGIHTIRVETGRGAAAEMTVLVDETAPARPRTLASVQDVPALTGGVSTVASQLDPVVEHLSALPHATSPVPVHPFRSPWWVWIFAGLLSGEWALRRRTGLR
jgi:hypothetical protein